MANAKNTGQETGSKGSSAGRGVSYPAISLEEAVKRAREFHEYERKNAAPLEAAAAHWKYSPSSSGVRTLVAALLGFGLMSHKGTGDQRQVQLTGRALDIILDMPERAKALQDAVKSPKIYSELLTQWGPQELPSDQTIKAYLLRNKNFNPKTVEGFIKDFRDSVSYSGLTKYANIPASNASAEERAREQERQKQPKVGDFVQWESAGTYQFAEPRKVTEVSDDGEFIFVEGISTGIPMVETILTQPPLATPPGRASKLAIPGIKQDTFSLDEGQVVLQWPSKITADSFAELKEWVNLQLRKIARQNSITDPSVKNAQETPETGSGSV